MQKAMLLKCGQELMRAMATAILPSLNCDAPSIQIYLNALQTADPKQWKDFFMVRLSYPPPGDQEKERKRFQFIADHQPCPPFHGLILSLSLSLYSRSNLLWPRESLNTKWRHSTHLLFIIIPSLCTTATVVSIVTIVKRTVLPVQVCRVRIFLKNTINKMKKKNYH